MTCKFAIKLVLESNIFVLVLATSVVFETSLESIFLTRWKQYGTSLKASY